MTKEEEIRLNHLEDHYCIMYAILGRTLKEELGLDGEYILRKGTRYYGQDRGMQHRKKHLDANMKINMKNLFTSGGDLPKDTRTFREAQRSTSEERVSHTLTCPMADIWGEYGCMDIGRIYCEEFHFACYNTYAYGYTKVNLSKTLTQEGDEYCSFNVVLRKADLPEELQKKCFEECDPDYVPPENVDLPLPGPKEGYSALWLKLYYYILKAAVEEQGETGKKAVIDGLHVLAQKVGEAFKQDSGNKVDRTYLEDHYPLYFDTDAYELWNIYTENDAKHIVENEFIHYLYEYLGV